MSDNYFLAQSGSTVMSPPAPSQPLESALGNLTQTVGTRTAAAPQATPPLPPLPTLIIDQAKMGAGLGSNQGCDLDSNLGSDLGADLVPDLDNVLDPEQKLQTYLALARRSQNTAVRENAFTLALRTQRMIVSATLSNTMPTALKIKTCEIPVLKLFLEFGLRSPEWRAFVVRMLCDNVETGTGHLTVNRAKQVLKELAKRAGPKVLANELQASTMERRMAAVLLLGWLKNERAIEPLVTAYDHVSSAEKSVILSTLETHYLPKLAFHLKWRHQSETSVAGPLLALLETACD